MGTATATGACGRSATTSPGGNDLGRNAQYGTLLSSIYLTFGGGGATHNLINNFRNIISNPCRA